MSETVFEHIRGNDTFTVTAAEPWSVGMIRRLQAKHPDQVEIICTNQDGSLLVHLPFEWMRIVPKKRVSPDLAKNLSRSSVREKMRANFEV